MITTKDIELAPDCIIKISSLTWDQVEQLMDTPIGDDSKQNRERAWSEVMMMVHNCAGQESMTKEDIKAKIDASFLALTAIQKFNELRNEGLKLSGYRLEDKKPGEALAAAATA